MIVHILQKNDWEKAKVNKFYKPDSFETEGFIHCSTFEQVIGTANFHYKNTKDMMILVIDENLLINKVVYEDLYNKGVKFPHIYSEINIDSVIETIDFPCNIDGIFELPEKAKKYLN